MHDENSIYMQNFAFLKELFSEIFNTMSKFFGKSYNAINDSINIFETIWSALTYSNCSSGVELTSPLPTTSILVVIMEIYCTSKEFKIKGFANVSKTKE